MGTTAWPLVGREAELARARRALDGPGPGVVIAGPLGVGRTRLADEVLDASEAGGATVVRLAATQAAATIPFGAAARLLVGVEADEAGDAALAAQRCVAGLAAAAPLVIGADDAHLLDDATAALLRWAAEARQARLVVTLRTGDRTPAPVRALVARPGWTRVDLAELAREDMRELLVRALGGEVESATVEHLWDTTRGNVLFLHELCRDALASGTLAQHHGVWTWTAGHGTSARLYDLVADRIGRLDAEERTLAGLLALGEPLPVAVVESLARPPTVRALRTRGLVTVTATEGGPVARLSHPLFGDGLRARLGPLERADLYARLVGAMGADADRLDADDRLRLAVWSIGSYVEPDIHLLTAAAGDARQRGDPALAERLARAALGQAASTGVALAPPTVPPPCRDSFEAALTLGEALADLGRPDEATAVLEPLVPLAADDADRARLALARLDALRLAPERLDEARALVASSGITDPVARDMVTAGLTATLTHAGALDEAGGLALGLLAAADERVRLHALAPAAVWLVHVGRAEQAVRAAMDLVPAAVAHEREVPRGRAWIALAAGISLVAAGQADEIDAALAAALDEAGGRQRIDRTILALLRGRAALQRGRPVTAQAALGEAIVALERSDPLGRHAWALSLLAEAHALVGDGDAARALLAARPTEGQSGRYTRDIERAELWVTVASGDVTGAIRHAVERADAARAAGHLGFELLLLHVALRLGAPRLGHRLAAVAGAVDGPLAAVLAELAPALAAENPHALDAAAERFAATGLDLYAAEAATRAAHAYRRAGAAGPARAAAERAAALRAGCEGARTPALDGPETVPAADLLTRREREVVALALQGLSSRSIAERLEVSVRTVDNQLGRAYRKLGITGRHELSSLVG